MDYSNPQFAAAVKKVLWQAIHDVIGAHNEQDANHYEAKADAQAGSGLITNSEGADEDHANGKGTEGESKTKRFLNKLHKNVWKDLEKPKTYVEFAALVFLILYTCETHKTNELTLRSLTANEKQFRIQQRPYVSPTPRAGAIQNIPHWTGKDKTKPPDSVDHVPVFRVPAGTDGSYRYMIGPVLEVRKRVVDYVPDYSANPTPPLMSDESQTIKSERDEEIPIISLTQDALIAKGDWEIYIVGGVRYEDILPPSIPPYETIYCFKVNPSGLPFGGCEIRKTTIR